MSVEQTALDRYNSRYNNQTFQTVQKGIVRDLCGGYQAEEPALLERALGLREINTIMNLIIDLSQAIVGYPHPADTRDRLLRALSDARHITPETALRIGEHFENFKDDDNTISDDFKQTMLALIAIQSLDLYPARNKTAMVAGKAGNAANALVAAADALLQLARLTLVNEPSTAYLREKLRAGRRYLDEAEQWLDLSE
ncbi:MAG: hypothetical protein ACOYL5_17950 [Phototrophicaceae bacterium]